MVDFSKIMALSEAANGFNGGSYVDEMPNYTLDEAVCYLPMMIMESQMEQYDSVAAQNELIVEAVVSSVQTGDNSNLRLVSRVCGRRLRQLSRRSVSSCLRSLLRLRLLSLHARLSLKSSIRSMLRRSTLLSVRVRPLPAIALRRISS